MIIFTAGYPSSGKTEFIKKLLGKLGNIKHVSVDPVSLRPEEYDSLSDEEQKKARICAWEVASEMLQTAIKEEPNSTLLIYDTCAANVRTIMPHFSLAKAHKSVFLILVITLASTLACAARISYKGSWARPG